MPRHDHDPRAAFEFLMIWGLSPALQKLYPAPGTARREDRRSGKRPRRDRDPRSAGGWRRVGDRMVRPFRRSN